MSYAQLRDIKLSGELLADFGLQPVSNRFLLANSQIVAPCFPFQLRVDVDTGLIHQGTPFPVDEIKPKFDWLTCFEPEDHLDDLAEKLTQLPGVTPLSVFGGYSFKDDSMLCRLGQLGYVKNWRIDPVKDLGVSDVCANVETYQSALTKEKASEICNRLGAADVLIVRHVIEHAYDLPGFIEAIKAMVKPDGYIVWELPDCERALNSGDCTVIWEEHIYYFTSFTFKHLLQEAGFEIVYYESVEYSLENSLIAIVKKSSVVGSLQELDQNAVAYEIVRAQNYAIKISQRQIRVRKKLEMLHAEYGKIAIFGAGHLSVAFLSLMKVSDLISCVIDDNPNKTGLQMPFGGLRIVGSNELYGGDIKLCLLGLNPQNQPKVIAKHQRYQDQGGKFVTIFPGSVMDLERL